ncbi:MAG: YbhB/YbcL family Raf kinase inhibitor-like protein [Hyphomicrobiaceae bacterium]|nr:YbhB/YbcL family Raf kinase inhibitor-like protein [Hyphomicrobiaceae bacterium]
MRRRFAAAAILTLLALAPAVPAAAGEFKLTSSQIADGGALGSAQVMAGFGCTGGNRSPALAWSGAPAGTKSFAVTVYDPDAPTGSGWWHWVLYNLPADLTALPENAGSGAGLPTGAVQGRTDYGTAGFGGACPPPGPAHRYVFTVHALKVERLELPADASAAMIGFMTRMNTLGTATLTATYGR